MARVLAIGDIHGHTAALRALLDAIAPQAEDIVITLGDYIDRGPDVPGAIETLLDLEKRCRLTPLLGNHEEILLQLCNGEPGMADWLAYGGLETLAAYDCTDPAEIPQEHIAFFRRCVDYFETQTHFFVHACYFPHLPLAEQPADILRWQSLRRIRPMMHISGKTAIVGHTAQKDGEILDLGHLKCIDTYCYGGKWLTALEPETGRVWQFDPQGHPRTR